MSEAVYTVGHSNQSLEEFILLLQHHEIEVLVDVRSAPYSRYVPHFNKPSLSAAVTEAGLKYVYLGNELGGRPDPSSGLYDSEGRALYNEIAETVEFRSGIERLKEGIRSYRIALMCSEENPTDCHRRLLIGRVLLSEDVDILHIRKDGHLDRESDLRETSVDRPRQASLFTGDQDQETDEWRSTRSVLPRNPRDSSSNC